MEKFSASDGKLIKGVCTHGTVLPIMHTFQAFTIPSDMLKVTKIYRKLYFV